MSTKILARLIFSSSKLTALTVGIEHVTLSRLPLRYYLDSVTVILTAPRLFKCMLCQVQTHAESPAGRVRCFKVAKIDPVSPFYPTIWMKKATLQWENPQEVRKTSL